MLEPGGNAMGEVICIGYGAGIGPEYCPVFQSNLAHLSKCLMVGMPMIGLVSAYARILQFQPIIFAY